MALGHEQIDSESDPERNQTWPDTRGNLGQQVRMFATQPALWAPLRGGDCTLASRISFRHTFHRYSNM